MGFFRKLIICILPLVGFSTVMASDWRLFPSFSGTEGMAETRDRVYFTSGGSLFGYDKDNAETENYTKMNYLNDTYVQGIYAPLNGNFVVITYSNGNIDVIDDKTTVTNLPDIKDSRLADVGINTVEFSPDLSTMLVGTSFGVVRFDLRKMEVKDSGIFRKEVNEVGFLNGRPVFSIDGRLYRLDNTALTNDISSLSLLGELDVRRLTPLGEKLAGIVNDGEQSHAVVIDFDETTNQLSTRRLLSTPATDLTKGTLEAPLFVATASAITSVDANGSIVESHTLPSELSGMPFTAAEGMQSMWFGLKNGVVNADITSSPVYTAEAVSPGEMSVKEAHHLRFEPSGKLYIGNRGNSNVFYVTTTGHKGYQCIMTPEGNFIDVTPVGLSEPHWSSPDNPESRLLDVLFMREDAQNPEVYYSGDLYSGFYALSSATGEELVHYSDLNSTLAPYAGLRVQDVLVDRNGSLWVLSERAAGEASLMVLPAEGVKKGSSVEKSDWLEIEQSKSFSAGRDGSMELSADGRYIYVKGNWDLLIYDTMGTPDIADDTAEHIVNFRMADGSGTVNFERFCSIMEDESDGSLWVTTFEGVFVIKEPWNARDATADIVRPKVARNDGTGLADYLLSTERVYGIDADKSNNKWLTTRDSGVYLVNEDGTQILEHFTSSNSPLASNNVYSVACDVKNSGKVYFGTDQGLMSYESGYSLANDDYNDVRIYPNPVRPDYYGDITIDGLVEGSRVKILSASGSLVAQLDSEGGRVRWNGKSATGARLPSGVYHVMASSDKSSGKPVGKIVIVR